MDIDPTAWLEVLKWTVANLPNVSLLLVIGVGAWVWLRDIHFRGQEEGQHESWLQMMLRERAELGKENRLLRDELFQVRRRRPGGREMAAPPADDNGSSADQS